LGDFIFGSFAERISRVGKSEELKTADKEDCRTAQDVEKGGI
jgi:hypothetical protein